MPNFSPPKKKPSVLFVSQSFYPSVGGVSTLLLNLSRYLHEQGYAVFAIHFGNPHESAAKKIGYPIKQFPISREELLPHHLEGYARFKEIIYQHLHGLIPFDYSHVENIPGYIDYIRCSELFVRKVSQVIASQKIDLVHLQDYQVIGCFSAIPTGIKTIFSLHAPLLPSINLTLSNWIMRYLNKADAAVFSIPEYSQIAVSLGLSASKIFTIPPIIDTHVMDRAGRHNFPQLTSSSASSQVITCVQRFDSKSGQIQLLKAFSRISDKHPRAKLVFAGASSFTDTISSVRRNFYQEAVDLTATLKLQNRVIFLGNVDYLALPQLYRLSDVVVMLSKMECFGLAVSEAMYLSKPTLVTDVGGLGFQIVNGQTGFKVKPGDIVHTAAALNNMLTSKSLRDHLGDNAKKDFNSRFHPHNVIPQYLKLYKQIAQQVKTGADHYAYLYNYLR